MSTYFLHLYILRYNFSQHDTSSKSHLLGNTSKKKENTSSYIKKMFLRDANQKTPTIETEKITEYNIAIIGKYIYCNVKGLLEIIQIKHIKNPKETCPNPLQITCIRSCMEYYIFNSFCNFFLKLWQYCQIKKLDVKIVISISLCSISWNPYNKSCSCVILKLPKKNYAQISEFTMLLINLENSCIKTCFEHS